MSRKRTTTYIFEQQLHAEYWDWEDDKKALFSNWESNKTKIFQEIHRRIKTLEEDIPAKVAFIVHDKDIKFGIKPIEPHIHAYIEFASRRDLSVLASTLGLLPQYIEPSGQGKYGKINSKAYLIHAKSPDKHQYAPSEVETFGTFDYVAFIEDNRADFSKRYAVAKREKSDESLDKVFQEIINGNLTEDDIFADEELTFLWSYNQTRLDEAFRAYGKIASKRTLRELENEEFKPTIIYVHGSSGIGKTTLALEVIEEIIKRAKEQGLNWKMYSAGAKNIFDEYFGEEVILLDDPRSDSLLPADWLKLLDPLNKSYLSARYKNKLVIGRLIVITNYQSLKSFFGKIQNEDLNQYIRRFNNVLEISKKKGNHDKEKDRFYNLSEVKELNYREYYQTGYDQEIQLHFGEEDIYCTDNKADFINRVLDEHILPRILPQIKKRPQNPSKEKGNA
ncbi:MULTISPECIES: Rep family protein [Streptococcus]|uniref:Rep family protein n=1 Tax=Streptococcus TaxID=1301 RepID=UPI000824A31E|nr:Rep family protein [Streptococcus dysgalactiae]OCX07683.1 plasmid replication protein [Streptococcus dysgalactiae subsp. equisimilis AKSDE4288]QET82637.1 plasmid replication protein [Streptococcus dysgalactiae]GET73300.1 hypothetical protein KNZ04_17880 [Streptococcus dysgalactiae subsp. equisimilis]